MLLSWKLLWVAFALNWTYFYFLMFQSCLLKAIIFWQRTCLWKTLLLQWSGCGCVLLRLPSHPGICLTSCRSTQPMISTNSSHCRFGFKDSHQLAPTAGSGRPEDTACMLLFREGRVNVGSTALKWMQTKEMNIPQYQRYEDFRSWKAWI